MEMKSEHLREGALRSYRKAAHDSGIVPVVNLPSSISPPWGEGETVSWQREPGLLVIPQRSLGYICNMITFDADELDGA